MQYDFTSIMERKGKDALAVDALGLPGLPGRKSRPGRTGAAKRM